MCWDTYETVTTVAPSYRDPVCGYHHCLLPQRVKDIVQRFVQSIVWSSEVPVTCGSVQMQLGLVKQSKIGYNSSQINTSFWLTNKNTFKSSLIKPETCT